MVAKHEDDLERFVAFIREVDVAMLTTADESGHLRSRPMMTQEVDTDGVLWFFSGSHDGKAHEIQHNAQVNISYALPKHNRFVSVSGRAELTSDRERIHRLWKPLYRAWFPEGPDDPKLSLLKVHIEKAEYWDSPSSTVVQIIGMTKALFSGKPYQAHEGEHGRFELQETFTPMQGQPNPPPGVIL